MERVVQLHINLPRISLQSWLPSDEQKLVFPYQQKGVSGTVSLYLDTDQVEWDIDEVRDPQTDESWKREKPVFCHGIVITVTGRYDPKPEPPLASGKRRDLFTSRYDNADLEFLCVVHSLALHYAQRFVSFVAIILGQYWVDLGLLSTWEMWRFFEETKAKWIDGDKESGVAIGMAQLDRLEWNTPRFTWTADISASHWNDVRSWLSTKVEPTLARRLLQNAKRHFDLGEYDIAAIETITALEKGVEEFVRQRCQDHGISKTRLDGLLRDKYIAVYLKLFLPLVLEPGELKRWLIGHSDVQSNFTEEQILEKCIALNSARNALVHEGEPILRELVDDGINAAESLLSFIGETGQGGL
jgi:hypothetical protein